MADFKEKAFSIDFEKLYEDLEDKKNSEDPKQPAIRTTVFSLGTDPRLDTKKAVGHPEIISAQLLRDGLDNPLVKLVWKIGKGDIDSGAVSGFAIFRRKLSEMERQTLGVSFNFDERGFDRLSRKNKKTGKFSEDRKALYNARRGSLPLSILNKNLFFLEEKNKTKLFDPNTPEDYPGASPSNFERFGADKEFERIAYVDYNTYLAQQKQQFESGVTIRSGNEILRYDSGGTSAEVVNRDFLVFNFSDKKVGFLEAFEYYVATITKEMDNPIRSNSVKLLIREIKQISPPALIIKQVDEKSVQLCIKCEPGDNVDKAIIYKKREDQISFFELAQVQNKTDSINVIDEDVSYAKTYSYRVFLQNIHGQLSQPSEITIYSSAQHILPQSRSNNLKIPIIHAVQDQSSEFVRITISPNDPNVAYYELKRRDLTIHERKFSVPSKENYGGNGWENNKFFVQKEHKLLNLLKTSLSLEEIVFIDNTVAKDHIYQYQVRGYDLFGNPTSYALSLVRVEGKKSLRSPINIRSKIIRAFPLRVKISWDDDNQQSSLSNESIFSSASLTDQKIAFLVQRRKLGESTYESFPLTENDFIIDEVASPDAVKFSSQKINDNFNDIEPNLNVEFDIDTADELRRSFKIPNFLKDNDVYFYRIASISANKEQSNFSSEFEVKTLADLSNPINFFAQAENTLVSPITVKLTWEIEKNKSRPDSWTIERKIDSPNESFKLLGRAYLDTMFFDTTVKRGYQYIYRIKSADSIRESDFFETRLAL